MKISNIKNLRLFARIISSIFIVPFSLLVIFMGLMFNKPAPVGDYLILASCSLYIIGLIISFKWEGLGGLISLFFLLSVITFFMVFYTMHHPPIAIPIGIYTGLIILMIPSILYLLTWYFQRRFENERKEEDK